MIKEKIGSSKKCRQNLKLHSPTIENKYSKRENQINESNEKTYKD